MSHYYGIGDAAKMLHQKLGSGDIHNSQYCVHRTQSDDLNFGSWLTTGDYTSSGSASR